MNACGLHWDEIGTPHRCTLIRDHDGPHRCHCGTERGLA